MQEDAIWFSRPVDFYNEQLMPLCGFGSTKRLVAARRKAVEQGWLDYQQGGKSVPSRYRVKIPKELSELEICRSESEWETEFVVPNRKGNGKVSGHLPYHNPNSSPGNSRTAKSTNRFTESDMEVACWMWELIQKMQPNRKQPKLEAWAIDIRKMRERDGRSAEEIRKLYSAINADDFWCTNILCPEKLRKKWDDLELKLLWGGERRQNGANRENSHCSHGPTQVSELPKSTRLLKVTT